MSKARVAALIQQVSHVADVLEKQEAATEKISDALNQLAQQTARNATSIRMIMWIVGAMFGGIIVSWLAAVFQAQSLTGKVGELN